VQLPSWAQVSPARRAHIARVTALLDRWALDMRIAPDERIAWLDAGRWHDALRDAAPDDLRRLVPASDLPERALHGPAAADRLAAEGEDRLDVLAAIRFHTIGHPDWDRTGRALYLADYLEPGRTFRDEEAIRLAASVPDDFDAAFRRVVELRISRARDDRYALHPLTVALWNRIR
jgi:2-amino-4-hydroxy-6-hydroxymethyldihydropteridine diphosphokinase